jgi:hypothetical protein
MMETDELKRKRKREPKAYYYPNGIKTIFKYENISGKLTEYGQWIKENPDGNITEFVAMRAAMK